MMWKSIEKGPYDRPMIQDTVVGLIIEPISRMTEGDKKQYVADIKVMNYLLQTIPNDIYNSVDACKNAKEMLMNEFDKFIAKDGESLESVYERLTTLVNVMDQNNVRPISVAINTKFLNCLQIEWQKAKKSAKSHDPLALMAHSHVSSSQSHTNSSHSPQPNYVTHPSSVVSNDDYYQEELQGDSQKDRLTSAMILLARAISQRFSNPTNNHLRTSSNTINQAVIQDGRVDIQTRNARSGGNGNRNAVRFNKNQVSNAVNGNQEGVLRTETNGNKTNAQCYNCNERGHFARDCPKPRVRDVKYFREQMLLAMKDEAGSNLSNTENDFMLDQTYDDDEMK
ncbi:putative reverse transcriptase domain-containing protein [Tanacetum coccineum]